MADSELMELYSGRILELASSIPHTTRLRNPDITVKRRSPQCGSAVTVDLVVRDGRIVEFGQDVKACALGQAAAAIVGDVIIGLDREAVAAARDRVRAMLTENAPVPPAPFDGFEALTPAREFKNRHASIMLVLDAATEGFETLAKDPSP